MTWQPECRSGKALKVKDLGASAEILVGQVGVGLTHSADILSAGDERVIAAVIGTESEAFTRW
jgi:hypothetical protein